MDARSSPEERPLRVLLLHMESTGAGHRRAAEAVAKALRAHPGAEATVVNIVDYMNDALHQLYHSFRTRVLEDAPHVIGQIYNWYDYEKDETSLVDRLIFSIERQSLRRLVHFLKQSRHDVAVHTHFFPAELAVHLRRSGRVRAPNLTVTTDFFSHAMWLHQPCERFFVATEEAALYLRHLGAAPSTIERTGIPVDPWFEMLRLEPDAHDRETERRLADIASGRRRPKVTFMATGLTAETVRAAHASLLSTELGLDLRVLTGGDVAREIAIRSEPVPARHAVTLIGATERVPEILADTDLLVGKAGGLTAAEAMAVGCPMAIVRPRPDQEEQNTDVLLERGAAVRVLRTPLLAAKIEAVFGEPTTWRQLRRNAHRFGKPDAARRIAEVAVAQAETYRRSRSGVDGRLRPRTTPSDALRPLAP